MKTLRRWHKRYKLWLHLMRKTEPSTWLLRYTAARTRVWMGRRKRFTSSEALLHEQQKYLRRVKRLEGLAIYNYLFNGGPAPKCRELYVKLCNFKTYLRGMTYSF